MPPSAPLHGILKHVKMTNPFKEIDLRLSNIESLLLDIKHKEIEPELTHNPERRLTIPQLIDYLPEHPARQTVYGWVSNRKVPFQKHGSRVFFVQKRIDEWLENGRVISHLKSLEG